MPTCGATPAACRDGELQDCTGRCAEAVWLGDGFCDEDYEGYSLNCEALSFDNGDCANGAADEFQVDCLGQRAPASWFGDGACDNGIYQHNGRWINFNCMEAMWDGGDCAAQSLTHMDCLRLVQDLDHCEAVNDGDGYRCETSDCVQAIQALAAGWDYCSDLLGLQSNVLADFQLVCGACSPMPIFELCGLGVHFPSASSQCNTLHCADAMIPWYESQFTECQAELADMAELAGLDVATTLTYTTAFHADCVVTQASNAPPPAPSCPPVFLGSDLGWSDVMSFSDEDNDCVLSMTELATVCSNHFAECISFLESSEDAPEPEPEPEDYCAPVYLGPDIGYANIMAYNDADGSCTISMAELAATCADFFNECISFLNGQGDASPDTGEQVFAIDGWLLMQGSADILDLGGDAELEFAALLRQDLSAALGTATDYIAVTNIYAADSSEEADVRSLHVSIELSAPGSVDAAQALFDELVSQQADATSALMAGVVSNTISQVEETRDVLATRICEPVFLGPDIGYVNVRSWNAETGECETSMTDLATACNAFFAECVAFLNSADAAAEASYEHLTPTVVTMASSTDDQHVTYRLVATLDASTASNMYTIFGTDASPMHWPGAYQCATPFGANTGGTNEAFWAIANNAAIGFAEFDSWLSVGITGGDIGGALSTIGLDFSLWNEQTPLDTHDGAVFWMEPNQAPGGEVAVGQITVAAGSSGTVTMGMQGRPAADSATGAVAVGSDWTEENVEFAYGE